MASAVVLPLQGVWNAVIYCATSWSALRGEVVDLAARIAPGWVRRRAGAERLRGDGWGGRGRDFGGARDRVGCTRKDVEMKGTVRVFRGGSF